MTLIEQLNAVIIAIAKDISNNSGNSNGSSSGNTGSSSSDDSALLPRKIGEKWYQSGLRYATEYPYPHLTSGTAFSFISGTQFFIPFTALEDATIIGLEVYCNTAQANATVSLGIYASDSNNDIANPRFTSDPIDCSTTGAKNAPCNLQIKKGKVYWLSSLVVGTPTLYRNASGSFLFPIKGNTIISEPAAIIGYYTTGNTSMAQSAPTNKIGITTFAPRVMFITG